METKRLDIRVDGLNEECLVYDRKKVMSVSDGKYDSVVTLLKMIANPKGNAHAQLQAFRKHVPKLLTLYSALSEANKAFEKENERLKTAMFSRNRKKWTKEEDDMLVEVASYNDTTIVDLCSQFGRSPGAISARLSQLVGISKTTQEIVGRFVGYVDGEEVSGNINGTVFKKGER